MSSYLYILYKYKYKYARSYTEKVELLHEVLNK